MLSPRVLQFEAQAFDRRSSTCLENCVQIVQILTKRLSPIPAPVLQAATGPPFQGQDSGHRNHQPFPRNTGRASGFDVNHA